ncbi:hypothetical protein [Brucella pituitosa]|uniref:hypothetical protein n=1 Tax=Brucella pituitosa TaxID=571256 RepID=UPI002091F05B|nr:hypothetical protein [Brucella pituitosa]
MIGEDEIVAKHIGINTTRVKVMLFAISSSFITLTGAIIAPRWTYLTPVSRSTPTFRSRCLSWRSSAASAPYSDRFSV